MTGASISLRNPAAGSHLDSRNVWIIRGSDAKRYSRSQPMRRDRAWITPPPGFGVTIGKRQVGASIVPVRREVHDCIKSWIHRVKPLQIDLQRSIVDTVLAFSSENKRTRRRWIG